MRHVILCLELTAMRADQDQCLVPMHDAKVNYAAVHGTASRVRPELVRISAQGGPLRRFQLGKPDAASPPEPREPSRISGCSRLGRTGNRFTGQRCWRDRSRYCQRNSSRQPASSAA